MKHVDSIYHLDLYRSTHIPHTSTPYFKWIITGRRTIRSVALSFSWLTELHLTNEIWRTLSSLPSIWFFISIILPLSKLIPFLENIPWLHAIDYPYHDDEISNTPFLLRPPYSIEIVSWLWRHTKEVYSQIDSDFK